MEYGANYLHSKADELSALYREIKPKVGRMINLCHQIEDKAYEPDLERVRKEAYDEGYVSGSKEDYDEAYLKGYNQGLADAWEVAKKLWDLKGEMIKAFRKYSVAAEIDPEQVTKTGRTFPEIATVLEKMREGQE